MAGFPTLKGLWPWPWIGSYGIPSCITHRPLPRSQISLKSKELFVDEQMDIRTHGRTLETGFIRSPLSKRRPKKISNKKQLTKIASLTFLLMSSIFCFLSLQINATHINKTFIKWNKFATNFDSLLKNETFPHISH